MTASKDIQEPRTVMPPPVRRLPYAMTRAGWLFLAMTVFVLVATVNSGVNLLYFLFGAMVGMLLISAVVASWSLRGLSIARDLGEYVVAGERVGMEYRITSNKRFWPAMAVELREIHPDLLEAPCGFVLHVPARTTDPIIVATHLAARRRGVVALRRVQVSTTFPFGFIRRSRRIEVPQEVVVYPRLGMLNRQLALEYREAVESGAMRSNRRGGADEFYGVREYRPGDNIRAIHWRSSARTGELMIREMAANIPPQMVIVLNLRAARTGGEALVAAERAIELAAALVCYGNLENFAVGLVIAGKPGGAKPPRMGRDARAAMLRDLALLDVRALETGGGIDFSQGPDGGGWGGGWAGGRAEWVVVTLHGTDEVRDLLPPGGRGAGVPGSGGHRTMMALDAPDAGAWVEFLNPEESRRLLRERDQ